MVIDARTRCEVSGGPCSNDLRVCTVGSMACLREYNRRSYRREREYKPQKAADAARRKAARYVLPDLDTWLRWRKTQIPGPLPA